MLAPADLVADKLERARTLAFAKAACHDGRAVRRQLVNHREVEVAVNGQRQRARNGCRRHHQHVGRLPFANQRLALEHAESVLFVHNHQAQAPEFDVLFEQRVRPHHQARFPFRDSPFQLRLFRRSSGTDEQVCFDRKRL